MWFVFALMTFAAWGTADLFYKKGSVETERYSHLKTTVVVGLVMGLTAVGMILFKGIDYHPINLLIYLPCSVMYISSMTLGYFGLRYLELSVSSPIQNASGAVSCLLIMFFTRSLPSVAEGVAIVLISFGVIALGVLEKKKETQFSLEHNKKYKIGFVAFLMPILYCFLDALGTVLDDVYILESFETTPLKNVTAENYEDVANISYMLTFFGVALVLAFYIYVIKKEPLRLKKQGNRLAASGLETVGQLTYVYAIAGNGMVAAPIIASYCVISVLLARIFLKEKLSKLQYLMVAFVFAGILLLGILEGLEG